MKKHCLLWKISADLALEHGFTMSGSCPVDATCTGERCIFLSSIRETANNIEKFNERMDKTRTIQKLANLREELKGYEK